MRVRFRPALFLRAFFLLASLFLMPAGFAPLGQPRLAAQVSGSSREFEPNLSSVDLLEEERRMRRLNEARQHQLVDSTQKLLALTVSYNAEIARDTPDRLTRLQLRRVAQIEKLARGVKERMIMTPGGDLFLTRPRTFPVTTP